MKEKILNIILLTLAVLTLVGVALACYFLHQAGYFIQPDRLLTVWG